MTIQLQIKLDSDVYGRAVRVEFEELERDIVSDTERQMAQHIRRLLDPIGKRGERTDHHWIVTVELLSRSEEEE